MCITWERVSRRGVLNQPWMVEDREGKKDTAYRKKEGGREGRKEERKGGREEEKEGERKGISRGFHFCLGYRKK